MRKEVYDIGGMHCAACSSAIERVTRKLPGVAASDVNLPMNRLVIEYDEAQTAPEMIVSKIEKAGFTARLHEDAAKPEAAAPADEDKALRAERARLILSVVFAGLLLVVSMGQMLIPGMWMPDIVSMDTHPVNYAILQMLLTIPVLILGKRFFTGGLRALFHGNPNMDTLVALSATASFLYSVVMTFWISDDPHGAHNLYYESAAVVVALVSVGKYMEANSAKKTKDAIARLMRLAPDTAIVLDGENQREVPTEQVKVGDMILVKPGARVPLDGVVRDGGGSVNEAMLTGESMPVEKAVGDEVIGGSASVEGALTVQVTKVGEDTTLAKIIRFVEDAQGKKAPISKTADKVAGVFVPIVIVIAIVAAIVWLIVGAQFAFALRVFTSVLVIACPCAMGLATPTAIIVATGMGASRGILVRSGEALEITHKVSLAVFDKTGTITEGAPSVTDVYADDEDTLISQAYAMEILSDHPLSKAICQYAEARGVAPTAPINDLRFVGGRGLTAKNDAGQTVLAGNPQLMREHGVDIDRYTERLSQWQAQGKTVVLVAIDKRPLGMLALADTIKPDAKDAIATLGQMGVKTVLLTGDNVAAARHIAGLAGITEAVAEVLPTQKADVIKRYQDNGEVVMMVGDGINDAPALTQADVGVAIGSGSDIAMDAADVVLMKSELADVGRAIHLGRLTIRNIRQNLFWAFIYNTLGIPVAAGILYPATGLLLSPMIGALAMSLSSLFVVTNALRLKGKSL